MNTFRGSLGRSCAMSAALLAASAGRAQVIEWDNAAGGNWSAAANWSPMNVPDTAAETARFSLAGTYTVNQDGSFTIGAIDAANPNVTVIVNNGNNLQLATGTMMNNGLVIVNSGGGSASFILFNASGNISGSGRIVLSGNTGFNDTAYVNTAPNQTVTQDLGHTISGVGRIHAALVNDGVVEANVTGGAIQLLSVGKTNNNIMRAVKGATLNILNIGITQGTGAVIRADGADTFVDLNSAAIGGGLLDAINGGLVRTIGGQNSLTSVTVQGPFHISNGTNVRVLGSGLTNEGTITINSAGGSGTFLQFEETGSLGGNGEVVLNGNTGFNDSAYVNTAANQTVTQAATHTIRGRGRIHAALINNGLVEADVSGSGGAIQLLSVGKTNNNIMRAVNGATLNIQSIGVAQGPGAVIRADGADTFVDLNSAAIGGGLLDAINGGLVRTIGGQNSLTSVTVQGPFHISNGTNVRVLGSGLTNEGTITINSAGGSGTFLQFEETGTLGGDGEVVLNGNTGFNDSAYVNTAANQTITQAATHTIRGRGRIHAALINNGLVEADVPGPGGAMQMLSTSKTNNATMRAVNGAELNVSGITLSQASNATLRANADSLVTLSNCHINGGRVQTGGTGQVIVNSGGVTFTDVVFSGTGFINNATNLHVQGSGLTNNGTITVNHSAGGSDTHLIFDATGTLDGTGTLVLNGNTGFNNTSYLNTAANQTVTQAATHTIRGRGRIHAALINEGLVEADVPGSGGAIELLSTSKTNNAVMRATGGGELRFSAITVTQGTSGVIESDAASAINLGSCTVVGGTIDAQGGSAASVISGGVSFSGVTNEGLVHVNNATNLHFVGSGNTNNGTIVVNPTGGGSDTHLIVDATQTIDGDGTVRLGASPASNTSYLNTAANQTATWGPGQTLTGQGRIFGNHVWQGEIAPGDSAGQIQVHGSLTLDNSSVFSCELAGTGPTEFDRLSGGPGTINLDGTLDISLIGGFTPATCGNWVIVQAGAVNGTFDTVIGPPTTNHRWRVFYTGTTAELRLTCYPDFDGNCMLDLFDFLSFVNLFNAMNPEADCDNNATFDLFDFLCFVNAFNTGC